MRITNLSYTFRRDETLVLLFHFHSLVRAGGVVEPTIHGFRATVEPFNGHILVWRIDEASSITTVPAMKPLSVYLYLDSYALRQDASLSGMLVIQSEDENLLIGLRRAIPVEWDENRNIWF